MLTHNELSRVWFFFVNIYVEISSHNSVWIVSLKCLNVSQGSRHLSVRHFRQIRTYRLKRAVAYENLPSKQMRCSCVGARLALHTIKLEPQRSKMWNGRINRSQDDALFFVSWEYEFFYSWACYVTSIRRWTFFECIWTYIFIIAANMSAEPSKTWRIFSLCRCEQ